MAEDHYKTLGISREATVDEIHKAYRELARKYHPDLNPDDETAKRKFQEIQQAYEVLKDPKKRELFDRFGPNFESMGSGAGGRSWRAQPGGPGAGPQGFEDIDLSEIFGGGYSEGGGGGGFSDIFRQFTRRPGRQGAPPARGQDIRHELEIPFRTAISGGAAQLSVRRQGGKVETINVKIPAGIEDGKKIRLRGQGEPGPGGAKAGDILITVRVSPHPYYSRVGRDLIVKVPVTLSEAALGSKIDLPTPHGTITITVPPGTSSGRRLRLKGLGVKQESASGDLFAEIQIVVPSDLNESTADAVRKLNLGPSDPRTSLVW